MSGIRHANTAPEVVVRSLLHRAGFRFSLHAGYLPGKPDIVLRRCRAVVVVNGCFWHHHDCAAFKWPSSNAEFWRAKIDNNVERDRQQIDKLLGMGWRVAVVWECAVRDQTKREWLARQLTMWLRSSQPQLSVP